MTDEPTVAATPAASNAPLPASSGTQPETAAATPAKEIDPLSTEALSALADRLESDAPEGKKTTDGKLGARKEGAAAAEKPNSDAKPNGKGAEANAGQPKDEDGGPEGAIAMPASWPAEMKDQWASLSPDVRKLAADRERDAHGKISEMGMELSTLKPLGDLREKLQPLSDRHGVEFEQGVERLFQVQEMMDRDPENTLIALARTYGVNLVNPARLQGGNQSPVDPRIARLEQELNRTQAVINTQQRETTAAEMQIRREADAWASNEIREWSQDKEYYDTLKGDMARLIDAGAASTLDDAYDLAIHRNQDIRAKVEAKREAERAEALRQEQERAVSEARRSARVATGDRPAMPSPGSRWDDPAVMAARYDRIVAGNA